MEIGNKLKKLRLDKDLTLQELARKTGLSTSFISQVERELTSPSLSSLKKITDALDVTLAYLFADEDKHLQVIRKDDVKKVLTTDNGKVNFTFLLSSGQAMEVSLAELQPGSCTGADKYYHHGEELAYVLEGEVTVSVEDDEYVLEEGDALYFQSNRPHRIQNDGDVIARAIWITAPPGF
ncbi:MAG: cupin domain-containing protein [Halanaerobium sp.]|nr:cupin domain-containing protein [Halanaerobium sp.]